MDSLKRKEFKKSSQSCLTTDCIEKYIKESEHFYQRAMMGNVAKFAESTSSLWIVL